MELIADLKHFCATEALQWAAGADFDGRLAFHRNRRVLTLSIHGGRIVGAESNNQLESFRQHLFAQGLADALELVQAQLRHEPDRLGPTLVEMEVLTPEALEAAVNEHMLDLACSLVLWTDGVVAAHASSIRPLTDPEPEPLEALFVTMEAARRVDELGRIRDRLPHENIEIGPGDSSGEIGLSAGEQRLLETLQPRHIVDDLYRLIGGSRFTFLKRVDGLISRGLLSSLHVGPAPESTEENQTSLVDVVFDGHLAHRLHA